MVGHGDQLEACPGWRAWLAAGCLLPTLPPARNSRNTVMHSLAEKFRNRNRKSLLHPGLLPLYEPGSCMWCTHTHAHTKHRHQNLAILIDRENDTKVVALSPLHGESFGASRWYFERYASASAHSAAETYSRYEVSHCGDSWQCSPPLGPLPPPWICHCCEWQVVFHRQKLRC